MKTLPKIGGTERLEDFSKYFELKKDEIPLKNQKKKCPDIDSKNMHINLRKYRSMETLSKNSGTQKVG